MTEACPSKNDRPNLRVLIARRGLLEDGTKPLLVETQLESVLVRKLSDLLFSIYLIYRPEPLQIGLVDRAVSELCSFGFQLTTNSLRKPFHHMLK
jgi:hypothetical protein